jgi:hypothetical protein
MQFRLKSFWALLNRTKVNGHLLPLSEVVVFSKASVSSLPIFLAGFLGVISDVISNFAVYFFCRLSSLMNIPSTLIL